MKKKTNPKKKLRKVVGAINNNDFNINFKYFKFC